MRDRVFAHEGQFFSPPAGVEDGDLVRVGSEAAPGRRHVVGHDEVEPLGADLLHGVGGEVWLCGACTKPRNITEDKVAAGAKIVGAAKVVEEVALGAKTIAFA